MMLKAAFAGALAFALMGSSLTLAETTGTTSAQHAATADAAPVVTTAHITRLKSVLKLNAAQRAYWPPVEAALRDLARQRAVLTDMAAARRVMIAALPLIHSLNDDQKRQALTMVRTMGFSAVVSAL